MIEVRELTRRYGDFTAVSDISFSVPEGEIVGLLGPNGAGKTTMIRMITGFLPPTRGQVTVAGHDLLDEPARARGEIGYLPENVALYTEMRVSEYLAYRARLQGMGRGPAGDAIADVVDRCLLADVSGQIIGTLSKGYRQRVGLAAAILHGPSVLVLDEPTVGLDPKQIIAIRELIRELGGKRTLLLSTHILPEVEQLCHRVLIIDRGRILAEGTPAELRQQSFGNTVLRITLETDPPGAAEALSAIEGVAAVRTAAPGRYLVEAEAAYDLRATLFGAAVDNGWVLLELSEEKASLEDIFVRLTTSDEAGRADGDADLAQAPAATESASGTDNEEEVAS